MSERDAAWPNAPGGKYYVTRGQSALVAFAVGGRFAPGASTGGFSITAAHTDSPCLRVKPISARAAGGYQSVAVETYGGGIWHTWFDRDLSVAGRAIVALGDGTFESRLVRVARPILRVPSLAIHLDRTVNDGFKVNAETHLPAVLATAVKAALEAGAAAAPAGGADAGTGGAGARHHAVLVRLLAAELGVAPDAVADFELCLYDTQPSAVGGACAEFVFAPRLDNLAMTHATLSGLLASVAAPDALAAEPHVRVMAAFNHEEVGSASTTGAGGTLLEEVLARLAGGAPGALAAAARRSFLVSADMAHALHPNYPAVHEEAHRPALHGGLVIKNNANQRYATDAPTAFLMRRVAALARVPLQNFCVRQDAGCGSTVGPILATRLGVRTVDVGAPQLSMHSVREMAGVDDVAHAAAFFAAFFESFPALDAALAGAD